MFSTYLLLSTNKDTSPVSLEYPKERYIKKDGRNTYYALLLPPCLFFRCYLC